MKLGNVRREAIKRYASRDRAVGGLGALAFDTANECEIESFQERRV
jgi:hypothetical protein